MKVAKACKSHGLQFAADEGAALIVLDIKETTTIIITSNIITTAFDNKKLVVVVIITTLSLCGLVFLLRVFDGADTELPVIVSVLGPELLQQTPVMVLVAFGQLLQVVGAPSKELRARQVGGA